MALEAGQQIRDGRYRITRVLGEGAQGTSFEAVDAKEGRLVAVKRFAVKGASSWKDVELAEREAVVLRSLSHPLIPSFIEHFEEDGALYLVTQLVNGTSLRALSKNGTRFRSRDIALLLHDLGQIAEYLHRLNPSVIHRDIKPGNVIRREDGRFVLVDFGAVRAKLKPTGGSTVVGTFGYMAPEQFQGRALPQSDIYAIGVTALSLLTSSEPEDLPHRGLGIDVRACLAGRVDPRLIVLLERMVHPDPDQRLTHISAHVGPLLATSSAPSGPDARGWDARGSKGSKRAEKERRREEKRFSRDERKEAKRSSRAEARAQFAARFAARPFGRQDGELGPPRELSGPLLALAKAGVTIGAIVVAPLVLSLLSIVFGAQLRKAAYKTREAGRRALARLDREAQHLERGASDAEARMRVDPRHDAGPRVRVDAPPQDAEFEISAEDEARAQEENERARRRR